MNSLYFLHGMESSPMGTKSQLLLKHYPKCITPELPSDIYRRKDILQELITRPAWLVGSSLGGLSTLMFAMENPLLVKGMIVLAPAVGFNDPSILNERELRDVQKVYIQPGIPCTVIAGEYDEVIPNAEIESMVERSPDKSQITLMKVKDNHSLNQSLDLLLQCVKSMIG